MNSCRSEWSQMKETFRNMQKENFKKLKAMAAKTGEDNREQAKPKKGFVKDCLVKVGLHKECEEHTKDVLKVIMAYSIYLYFLLFFSY